MKKFTALLLCALMAFSCAAIPCAAAENELTVTVVNDLHLNLKDGDAVKAAKRNSISEVYAHAATSGQLTYESIEIIKAFLADAAASDSSSVLMPGDLTTLGTKEEHEAFVALIKDFEQTSGKNVFVIPGNHDLFSTSVAEFEELYADFGYGEAIANDPDTASYVAELGGGYRLLAIDSTTPGGSPHGVDERLVGWVKAQCDTAKADGRKLIAITHYNLIEHIVLISVFHKSAVINDGSNALADTLADGGVKFIFTAHTHDQDIAKHTSEAGNVIYDCVTTALNAYPCAYRRVELGDEVKITTKNVTAIDTSTLPAGIHEEAMALAEKDFLSYAKNCTYTGITATITSYTKAATLKKLLKIEDEQLRAVLDPVIEKVCEAVQLPIYKADEKEEGKSLEAMASALDTTLPATDYGTLVDLAVALYQAHAEGDENFPAYSDEMILLQRALAVVLNYALADLSAADYTKALTFAMGLLGVEVSDSIISMAGGALENFKGKELVLTSALMPVLTKFSVDDAPADNNVTLAGYGSTSKTSAKDFLEMVKDFFRKMIDFFRSLFAMLA